MKRLFCPVLLAVSVFWSSQPALADARLDKTIKRLQENVDNEAVSVYGGAVGKLAAIFFIEWTGTGNPVEGYYYYPSRGKEKTYKLKGSNPKQGVLVLQEYTPDASGVLTPGAPMERLHAAMIESGVIRM